MRKNKKNLIYSILLLILLSIGIGYAYLTSNLSIAGSTEIAANSWDIHFANLVVSEGSVTATTPASINPTDTTSITYSVLLSRPKQFYEFTVDMVNEGTLPGKISLVSISGITQAAEDLVDYSIKYENGRPVVVNDILNGNDSKNIKVRVYYNDDIDIEDLPSTNIPLTLTLDITFVQSDKDEFDTNALIQQLKTENSSCFTKYTGEVTDRVGETVTASNVYFNKCEDKRNIIFNNMCWQMIRTTETGGIKMIYNGDVVDGKCLNTRGDHKGIVQSGYGSQSQNIASSYLYGSSFTYDISTNEFTLTDTITATWSDSTYENLIGRFTCKTSSDTCTTLYQINGYESNTNGYVSYYTITDTNYAQIGTSSFNANNRTPAMVGYMFNKIYNYKSGAPTSDSLMGNDVSYSNGTYTLLPADGENELGTTLDATHHYTCNTTSSTCTKVKYYYYSSDSSHNYYIELDGEANIDEAVNNMLYNDNVNRYNSSIKGIIDAWYRQNLLSKTNMLEDTIYCNARNMINHVPHGWNKDGDFNTILFKNYFNSYYISCAAETDQFSTSNNKAKLTYPVALISEEEWYNIGTNPLRQTGATYFVLSPSDYNVSDATVRGVSANGGFVMTDVGSNYGSRPAVTLSTGAVISSGSGTESDPFIISE